MPGAAPEVSERPERFSDAAPVVFLVGLWPSNQEEHAEKPRDSGGITRNPPPKKKERRALWDILAGWFKD